MRPLCNMLYDNTSVFHTIACQRATSLWLFDRYQLGCLTSPAHSPSSSWVKSQARARPQPRRALQRTHFAEEAGSMRAVKPAKRCHVKVALVAPSGTTQPVQVVLQVIP